LRLLLQTAALVASAANAQPHNLPPYDPDRAPGKALYTDISPRLSPASVIQAARNAFARRNWQISSETPDSFDARYRSRDIEARLHVFFTGNALRYIDDSTIGDGAQRAMAPTTWMNNVRLDLRSALATMTVREQGRPVPHASQPKSGDPAERLRTLKALLDAGAITQAEYDAKRAEILKDL
jgi:hypothetical protein